MGNELAAKHGDVRIDLVVAGQERVAGGMEAEEALALGDGGQQPPLSRGAHGRRRFARRLREIAQGVKRDRIERSEIAVEHPAVLGGDHFDAALAAQLGEDRLRRSRPAAVATDDGVDVAGGAGEIEEVAPLVPFH